MKYLFCRRELLDLLERVIREVDPDLIERHPSIVGVSEVQVCWGRCTLSKLLDTCLEDSEE